MTVAPPQDLEAEQAVLGAVLLSETALPGVIEEGLRPQDFYREGHGRIYLAMLEMRREAEPIDSLTLRDRLKRDGALEQVGGKAAIDLLCSSVPAVANYRAYARVVVRKSMWRERWRACAAGMDAARAELEGEYRGALGTMRRDELHFRPLVERAGVDL